MKKSILTTCPNFGGHHTDLNSSGCDSVINLEITIVPKPIAGFSIVPVGDSIPLGNISATNNSVKADSVFWLLNNQLITLLQDSLLPIDSSGNYCVRLIASSLGGCSDTSQQCVYVFANTFVMPNAFTPNGDGINDLFYPVFINPNNNTRVVSFSIYNRWGQLVYDNPLQGWDGTYRGSPQPEGIYTYFTIVSSPVSGNPGELKQITKAGSFALFR